MPISTFRVMIIGGGLGGLCLAQGLKKAGMRVTVFEQDKIPLDHLQAYRLSIEPWGSRALHACLPPHLFQTYVATSVPVENGHRIVTEQLDEVCFFSADTAPSADVASVSLTLSVSRTTLQKVLLSGLDEIIHFNKTFLHYHESPDGTVTACFEDGSSETGDVLVAADGSHSRVRHQMLPQAQRVETGALAIMGKLTFSEENRDTHVLPGCFDCPTTILGSKGYGMLLALHDCGHQQSAEQMKMGEDERREGSLSWGLVARREKYPEKQELRYLNGQDLQQMLLAIVQEWHPQVQRLIRETDPTTISSKPLRRSLPIKLWQPRRVTLLGDAIHSMPPTRGVGGNAALYDAGLLCRQLVTARDKKKSLQQAIHEYEVKMVKHGFAAVRASMQMQNIIVMENLIGRLTPNTLLRTLEAIFSFQLIYKGEGKQDKGKLK